jgi:hypothetical protein
VGVVWAVVLTPSAIPARAQAPPVTRAATGPLADSLRTFALQMAAMLRERDAPGVLGLYGDTLHFVHVDDGDVIPWPQLSAMVRRYFAAAKSNPIRVIGDPGVTIVDANNAVLYVNHHFASADNRPAHSGIWTGVLHRFPVDWRIVHSHSSDRRKQ